MKSISIIILMVLASSMLFPQDIINETGAEGKFIVRDSEQQEALVVDEGGVSITGGLKVEELEEGSIDNKIVVWDRDDKSFKAVDRIFSNVSPLSEPLEPKSWHRLGYTGVDEEGNEIDMNVNSPNAVTWNQFDTDYGYIKLGPANATGYAHIYTGQDKFMFDKPIYSKTGIIGGFGDLIFNTGTVERMRYVKDTGFFGVGTSTPKAKFHVKGDNGFIVQGTVGEGTAQNLGAGTRMHFYPKKSAFRVGYVGNSNWDDSQIGNYSIAMGGSSIASGEVSTAFGNSTAATGSNSIAMGFFTHAGGTHSTAFGHNTKASGYISTAIGSGIQSSGEYSIAIALSDQTGVNVTQNNTMSIMGGNVGINETTPDFPLHIYSIQKPWSINHAQHIKLEVPNGWWTLGVDDQADDADLVFRSNEDTDGFTAYIDPESGNMAITSDKRYKKNIEPLTKILDKIALLKPISYHRLKQDDSEQKELGFIAQDVNEIFSDNKVAKLKNDYWSLFYDNFGTIAIAGIKELKEEKDAEFKVLKEENKNLNAAIFDLIKRVEQLESN